MNFWTDNRTKILGSFIAIASGVTVMISSGTFEDLLSPIAIRWLSIVCQLFITAAGVWTIGVGVQNTTKERVAESKAIVEVAKAETAIAMETALRTEPPAVILIQEEKR